MLSLMFFLFKFSSKANATSKPAAPAPIITMSLLLFTLLNSKSLSKFSFIEDIGFNFKQFFSAPLILLLSVLIPRLLDKKS